MHKKARPTPSCGVCVSVCMSVCVSVCVSVTFVHHVKTNKHIFEIFLPSGSHTILVFPYQTGWRYSDGNPPKWGVECRWSRQKSRFWSNSWLSKIAGLAKCQKHLPTTKLSIWHSRLRTTGYIDCWTCGLRSDKNSYRRPCSVDRTVSDTPSNVCLWRPAAWTNTPKRREQKLKLLLELTIVQTVLVLPYKPSSRIVR